MKQCIMIDGVEIQYTIETKDIFAVLGSVYIYKPVTFLDTIRIIYRGLLRTIVATLSTSSRRLS